MADFDPITVSPFAPVLHDREMPRTLSFDTDDEGNLTTIHFGYDEYRDDGVGFQRVRKALLRQSEANGGTAKAWFTSFCADPKAALAAWLNDKTYEEVA